jgi:hypothetical protein
MKTGKGEAALSLAKDLEGMMTERFLNAMEKSKYLLTHIEN